MRFHALPFLVRFLVGHAVAGIGVAVLFVSLMVAFDIARLGTLLWGSPDGALAVAVLTLALGVTFGSVQMGFAVMLLPRDDEPPGGRRARLLRLVPRPARTPARASARR